MKVMKFLAKYEPYLLSAVIFIAINILVYMFLNGMANVGCSGVPSDYRSPCFTFRPALAAMILVIDILIIAFIRLSFLKR